jgi:dihydrofolate reductase
MRKLIAAINMTLDGVCDHTAGIADDEIHEHYSKLLRSAHTILYGRITYELMTYWPGVVKDPTGDKAIDEFAVLMDNIPKLVFSHTLKDTDPIISGWKTVRLATRDLKTEVQDLMQLPNDDGKDIFVGSRSLIISLLNLNLIDEFQLCVQPIIAGKGMLLFENINDSIALKLIKTKLLESSGSIILYYEPVKK